MSFVGRLLSSLVLRLIITAAVLILGYIFIAKPLIDSAQETTGGITDLGNSAQQVMDTVSNAVEDGDPTGIIEDIQRKIAGSDLSQRDARRLKRCIDRAGQDMQTIRGCAQQIAG